MEMVHGANHGEWVAETLSQLEMGHCFLCSPVITAASPGILCPFGMLLSSLCLYFSLPCPSSLGPCQLLVTEPLDNLFPVPKIPSVCADATQSLVPMCVPETLPSVLTSCL